MRKLMMWGALCAIVASAPANAIPEKYDINFTTLSGAPTPSGSFTFDRAIPSTTHTQFSAFTVLWNTATFDFTSEANEPTGEFIGSGCGPANSEQLFVIFAGFLGCGGPTTLSWSADVGFSPTFQFIAHNAASTSLVALTLSVLGPYPIARASGEFAVSPSETVPEPSTFALFGVGLLGLGAISSSARAAMRGLRAASFCALRMTICQRLVLLRTCMSKGVVVVPSSRSPFTSKRSFPGRSHRSCLMAAV